MRLRLMLGALLAVAVLRPPTARGQVPHVEYSSPRNVSNSPGALSQYSTITQDSARTIFIGWGEAGGAQLLLVRSADEGATFSARRIIAPGDDDIAYGSLDLAAGGPDVVHAAATVYDLFTGNADILYARTADGGVTFSPRLLISPVDNFNSVGPAVAAGWAVAMAWTDVNLETGESAIRYVQSLDGGTVFSPMRTLSTGAPGSRGCPSVTLSGTEAVFVAWTDGLEADRVMLSKSVDGGATFSAPLTISSQPPQRAGCPRLVMDGSGTILAFWTDGPAFAEHMVFARSTDGGASFSPPVSLSAPGSGAFGAQMASIGDGRVVVSWLTGPYESYRCQMAAVRMDGTFSPPVEPPLCGVMSTGTPGALHLVWSDTRPDPADWEVFHSRGAIRPDLPRSFFALPPCRVVDTRDPTGAALQANTRRNFPVGGRCGIPLDAVAVAANLTVTRQTNIGNLRVYAAGGGIPDTSVINFVPGRTRANNATIGLGTEAAVTVQCDMPPPGYLNFTDFVMDVFGYYR